MQIVLILLSISIILNALQVNQIGIGFSVIMMWIVYSGREKYRRGLLFHLNIQFIAVFWTVSIAVIYGIIGYPFYGNEFTPPIDNYIRAFYFTVTTITTVGYGDIVPASDNARLFTSSQIIIGVAVFLSSTLLIGETLIHRLDIISKRVREEDKLKDNDSKDQH
jgi:voltage-gated potassium channel